MSKNTVVEGTQTVDRAFRILEVFTVDAPTWTLSEISEVTGLTVPTAHRLLRALQQRHFVALDSVTRRYSLGSGPMRLASVIMERDELPRVVLPHLEKLRHISGETTAIHWLNDDHRTCVFELVSRQPIRMGSGMGRSYPLHCGAAGKAILANLGQQDIDRILDRAAQQDPRAFHGGSRAALEVDLKETRERGYATSMGEVVDGASAIAAAILSPGGLPNAALNVTGPAFRWTEERIRESVDPLLEAVAAISAQIGHNP